jgi:hypothetical protein
MCPLRSFLFVRSAYSLLPYVSCIPHQYAVMVAMWNAYRRNLRRSYTTLAAYGPDGSLLPSIHTVVRGRGRAMNRGGAPRLNRRVARVLSTARGAHLQQVTRHPRLYLRVAALVFSCMTCLRYVMNAMRRDRFCAATTLR